MAQAEREAAQRRREVKTIEDAQRKAQEEADRALTAAWAKSAPDTNKPGLLSEVYPSITSQANLPPPTLFYKVDSLFDQIANFTSKYVPFPLNPPVTAVVVGLQTIVKTLHGAYNADGRGALDTAIKTGDPFLGLQLYATDFYLNSFSPEAKLMYEPAFQSRLSATASMYGVDPALLAASFEVQGTSPSRVPVAFVNSALIQSVPFLNPILTSLSLSNGQQISVPSSSIVPNLLPGDVLEYNLLDSKSGKSWIGPFPNSVGLAQLTQDEIKGIPLHTRDERLSTQNNLDGMAVKIKSVDDEINRVLSEPQNKGVILPAEMRNAMLAMGQNSGITPANAWSTLPSHAAMQDINALLNHPDIKGDWWNPRDGDAGKNFYTMQVALRNLQTQGWKIPAYPKAP